MNSSMFLSNWSYLTKFLLSKSLNILGLFLKNSSIFLSNSSYLTKFLLSKIALLGETSEGSNSLLSVF